MEGIMEEPLLIMKEILLSQIPIILTVSGYDSIVIFSQIC